MLVGTEYYGLFHTIDGGSNLPTHQMDLVSLPLQLLQEIPQMLLWQPTTGVARSSGSDWSNLSFVDSSCSVNSASQISIVSDSDGLYSG